MNNDWNNIEGLFKSSLGSNPGGEPFEPWSGLEKRVRHMNFFKFSLVTFNVYYLSLLVLLAGSLGFTTFEAIRYKNQIKEKNEIIRQYENNLSKEKISVDYVEPVKKNVVPNCNNGKQKSILNQSPPVNIKRENKPKDQPQLFEKKQTQNTSIDPDTVTTVTIKRKVIKRQVVIKKSSQINDSSVVK